MSAYNPEIFENIGKSVANAGYGVEDVARVVYALEISDADDCAIAVRMYFLTVEANKACPVEVSVL